MATAKWNGQIIAQSDNTEQIEGNHYFPIDSVKNEFLKSSDTHTSCHWKGVASYYTLEVDGKSNPDAAWYYPTPSSQASAIKDHIAFWKGVEVE